MADYGTLLSNTPRVHTALGRDRTVWFDLNVATSTGVYETALVNRAKPWGGGVRTWPEPIASGTPRAIERRVRQGSPSVAAQAVNGDSVRVRSKGSGRDG
jgi:hypothetical protein